MRSFLLSFLCLFITLICNSQIIDFPDISLKYELVNEQCVDSDGDGVADSDADTNDDGEIQITEAENITSLVLITNTAAEFEGLEYFINLERLIVYSPNYESLDAVPTTNLNFLELGGGSFPTNQLNLTGFTNLSTLVGSHLEISTLDLGGLINLETLMLLGMYDLTGLDLSDLTSLEFVEIPHSDIQSIDLDGLNSLEHLDLNNSYHLMNIDLSGLINLSYLDLSYNEFISNLDASQNHNLITLNLQSSIDLQSLNLKNGSIEDINIEDCSSLQFICVDGDEMETIQDIIDGFGYDCVVNTYCSFGPGGGNYVVEGQNKVDTDLDGCDDNDDIYPNLKFNISDGINNTSFMADSSGNYNVSLQEGSYTLIPELVSPNYYSISPTTISVDFSSDESPYNQDFCITPDGVYNDLEVLFIPLEFAIPGFEVTYKIVYRNVGSVTLSGEVTFDYSPDSDYMQYLGSNPSETTNVNDVLSWDFIDLMPFEEREIIVTFNLNTSTDPDFPLILGDALNYEVTISPVVDDETPNNNDFGFKHVVVNSFDPNDIRCLEGESILPERVGDYVHYLIRFENLGTANATNIVVNNPIDITKFDISTLIPLNGSHDFYTRINPDNDVEFIFENIQLPFDDANNDGYLTYKIKTLESLELGETFNNNAEIYFDFNAPVITNTYTTLVSDGLSTNEFNILDVSVFPNPVNHNLTIESATVLDKAIVYDVNGREVLSSNFEDEYYKLDLTALESGFYILKVFSVSGNKTIEIVKR